MMDLAHKNLTEIVQKKVNKDQSIPHGVKKACQEILESWNEKVQQTPLTEDQSKISMLLDHCNQLIEKTEQDIAKRQFGVAKVKVPK